MIHDVRELEQQRRVDVFGARISLGRQQADHPDAGGERQAD